MNAPDDNLNFYQALKKTSVSWDEWNIQLQQP